MRFPRYRERGRESALLYALSSHCLVSLSNHTAQAPRPPLIGGEGEDAAAMEKGLGTLQTIILT